MVAPSGFVILEVSILATWFSAAGVVWVSEKNSSWAKPIRNMIKPERRKRPASFMAYLTMSKAIRVNTPAATIKFKSIFFHIRYHRK